MAALILDQYIERRMIARRRRLGQDHWDEVWDGVYVMAPSADNQHFEVSNDLATVLTLVVKWAGLGTVIPGINISDRKDGWAKNFRVPDLSVFLNGSTAEDCGTFWFGGPDFVVEVVSPRDRSRKKIPFYEKIGTRELFLIDRRPWRLTLLRLVDGKLAEVGQSTLTDGGNLVSNVLPLTFRLSGTAEQPAIVVKHHDGQQQWTIEARQVKRKR
jgi:Uma2 family endonuclease